jgi:aminoglycoside phosphotransferase family enzyme
MLHQDAENDSISALVRKVAFLSLPESYTPAPGHVDVHETHMSWVFMAGDRVYKLKKPVRFPYLDFSTLDRRAAACQAEANLNRRMARDIYVGVAPLTKGRAGDAVGGSGRVADWLVVMCRLNENETLEAALRERRASRSDAERLANILARFYLRAARILIDPETYLASLYESAVIDWQMLLNNRFDLPRGKISHIIAIQRRFFKYRPQILISRVHRRHIVDGHGDLRPEDIWLTSPFSIIDCLEFNPRLRALDALDEIAFLHLECERLGEPWIGDAIRQRLARMLRDNPASGLFLFYRIGRAMLRALLSIAHLIDLHPRTPEKWPRLARTYLALADADAKCLERLLSRDTAGEHQAW